MDQLFDGVYNNFVEDSRTMLIKIHITLTVVNVKLRRLGFISKMELRTTFDDGKDSSQPRRQDDCDEVGDGYLMTCMMILDRLGWTR